jgi:hypothetical protein
MNERRPLGEHDIEALVREHLLHEEETVDAARIVAGVRGRMQNAEWRMQNAGILHSAFCILQSRRVGWRLAAAAAILLALVWGLQVEFTHASAASLVETAQKVHSQPLVLCYRVQTLMEPGLMDVYRELPPPDRAMNVQVCGDQFWMELTTPNRQWSMGQDEQGRVWMAFQRHSGFSFEANKLPDRLRIARDLRSMRIKTLLRQLVADYDLRAEKVGSGSGGATQVIHAMLKPGRQRDLRNVTIEMDDESKVVQRVVLARVHPGGMASRVTFTLIEKKLLHDKSVFRLEGHLDPGAEIFSTETMSLPQMGQELRKHLQPFGRNSGVATVFKKGDAQGDSEKPEKP